MKNEKGYIDGNFIFIVCWILVVIGIFGFAIYKAIYSRTVGNMTKIDLNYTFKKAIVCMGDEKIELNVKSWKDYDGEQIQIVTEDDKVYLVSSFNTILISE